MELTYEQAVHKLLYKMECEHDRKEKKRRVVFGNDYNETIFNKQLAREIIVNMTCDNIIYKLEENNVERYTITDSYNYD